MPAVATPPQEPITDYVMLGGTHIQDNPEGTKGKNGKVIEEKFQFENGKPMPLVRSRDPLAEMFPSKFRRADAYMPQAAGPTTVVVKPALDAILGTLDLKQLQAYAEAEEIDVAAVDLKKPTAKEELLKVIRSVLTKVG